MATNIVMPQMGYDMREGTVVRWHKQEGEVVNRGEVIAEIETDKATVEFEAYTGGVLRRIVAEAGNVVPVGELIAIITAPDEELPEDLPAAAEPVPASEVATESSQAPSAPSLVSSTGEVRASPIARRLARERGIDLAAIQGTGPGGRIVERDVLEYSPQPAPAEVAAPPGEVRASPIARRLARERGINLATIQGTGPGGRVVEQDVLDYSPPQEAPSPAAESVQSTGELVELSRMRQTIARVTVDSKREAPHFYLTSDIDMTRALSLRQEINDNLGADRRVSINDMVVKACALALDKHPKFNSSFQGDHLQMNSSINIGIAIALEAGLIVPGISNCESRSLAQIAEASRDLNDRSRSGTLRNEEYSGTTFSISNLGMFDVDSFAAIIYPPHAAVLAVGTVRQQPVVRSGELAVADIMKATLSTDHRVADGAEAAVFLVEVKKLLENPLRLLL